MRKMSEVLKMEEFLNFSYEKKVDFGLKYTSHYSFVRSLCIKGLKEKIRDFVNGIKGRFDNFVQVGIGGSALPATASLDFLGGASYNFKDKRYIVLDNLDPERLDFVFSLNLDRTLFHIVSKSGSTVETLSQFFVLFDKFKDNLKEQFVFTTSKKGFLYELGCSFGVETFFIPDEVGGRYSSFTPVALLPLAFFGYDIEAFIEGAKTAVRAYRNGWGFPNDFVNFAIGNYNEGKNILVMFVYKDRLRGVSEWFRQLWAESLGKDGRGQTPVGALGVTDQHSQLQLYQEGPKDKAIVFVDMPAGSNYYVEDDLGLGFLRRKSVADLMQIEKASTIRALKENGVPVGDIYINGGDEFGLGAFLMSLMIATAKAGEVLGINPFNQPGVELGKKYTKGALKNG